MDALCSRGDFLATKEDIVRVRVVGVIRARHCVEWTCGERVAIDDIEISVVLRLYELPKLLFLWGPARRKGQRDSM